MGIQRRLHRRVVKLIFALLYDEESSLLKTWRNGTPALLFAFGISTIQISRLEGEGPQIRRYSILGRDR